VRIPCELGSRAEHNQTTAVGEQMTADCKKGSGWGSDPQEMADSRAVSRAGEALGASNLGISPRAD